MKKDKIFARKLDGRVMEIGNWEARSSENDAFIGVPLSDSGLRKLRSGRERGRSDQQIFQDLHHRKDTFQPALSLEDLTAKQLATIAIELLGEKLETLHLMTKSDLIKLVRGIAKLKKVNVGLDLDP